MSRAHGFGWSAGVLAACVFLAGGNCGPTAECSADSDCGAGRYCRDSDGQCYTEGFCEAPADCDEQQLVHIMCVGAWSCETNSCAYHCGGVVLPGMGQACDANGQCAPGLECVSYYGIAGPSGPLFTSCEHRCQSSTDCGANEACVTIADGPGQVCRTRG